MNRRSHIQSRSPLYNNNNNEEDEILSNSQSRIIYEQKQNSVLDILKYLIFFIILIVLILIFRSYLTFGDDSSIKQNLENMKQKARENIQSKTTPVDENDEESGSWTWFRFCDNKWSKLEEELKNQRFGVQKFLPELPDHDEIKNNPRKYDLDGYARKSENQDFYLSDNDPVTSVFNDLIKHKNLDKNSNPDDLKNLNSDLNLDKDKFKNAEKLLDNNFIFKLKKTTQDLTNSQKNLVNKKLRLNKFRQNYFVLMKRLEECSIKKRSFMDDLDKNKNEKQTIFDNLKDINDQLKDIELKLKERTSNLSSGERARREKIKNLKDRIMDIRSRIKDEPSLKREIEKKRLDIENFLQRIKQLNNNISLNEGNMIDLENRRSDLLRDNQTINKKLQIIEKKKRIHEMKLELSMRDYKVKAYLNTLLNSDQKIEDLDGIVKSKISEEEKLLQSLEDFEKIRDAMKGEVIIDTSDTNDDKVFVQTTIEKDKMDLEQITTKYRDLKNALENYQSADIEIKMMKKTVETLKGDMEGLIRQRRMNLNELDGIEMKLKKFRMMIARDKKEVSELENRIAEYRKYIFETDEIQNKLRLELADLQFQLDNLENERRENKTKLGAIYQELENERNRLFKRKKELEELLRNFDKEIDRINVGYRRHNKVCISLRVYHDESVKILPKLKGEIEKNENIINKLKMKLKDEIRALNDF